MIWQQLEIRHGRAKGTREMIASVRADTPDAWLCLITAVKEARHLGVSGTAANDSYPTHAQSKEGQRHTSALAEDLQQFERSIHGPLLKALAQYYSKSWRTTVGGCGEKEIAKCFKPSDRIRLFEQDTQFLELAAKLRVAKRFQCASNHRRKQDD